MRILNQNPKKMKNPNSKILIWFKKNESIISIAIKLFGESFRVLIDILK